MELPRLHVCGILALSLSWLLFTCSEAQEAQAPPCSIYYYQLQPVVDLPCNPYFDPTSVALKCTIKGPVPPNNTYVNIAWFRRLDGEAAGMGKELEPVLDLIDIKTDSARISDEHIVSSVLRITILDVEPGNLTGMYWCAVKAAVDTRFGERQYLSLRSDTTRILPETAYTDSVRCSDAYATTSGRDNCVAFEAIPDFLSLASNGGGSEMATLGEGAEEEGDPVLNTTTIAVLAAVGVALLVVIHVLLVIVICLCMRSRRKRRAKMPATRKISSAPLIPSQSQKSSTPPAPQTSRPPQPPKVLPLSGSKPPNPLSHLPSPHHQLPSPPKSIPPAPTRKPPVLQKPPVHQKPPNLRQGQHTSLPPRLTNEVLLMEGSDEDEEYAPIQIKGKRAATLTGEIIFSTADGNANPFADDKDQVKYKSLNRSMMNGHQVYEDPCTSVRRSSDYNIDRDEEEDENGEKEGAYQVSAPKTVSGSNALEGDRPSTSSTGALASDKPKALDSDSPNVIIKNSSTPSLDRLETRLTGPKGQSPISNSTPSMVKSSALLSPQSSSPGPLPARVSVDGEYVLPNGAFEGVLPCTKEEREGVDGADDEDLADYIDVA